MRTEGAALRAQIIQTLVTDIEPDAKVRVAMNEINAAVRQRAAALEKAEAGARIACRPGAACTHAAQAMLARAMRV